MSAALKIAEVFARVNADLERAKKLAKVIRGKAANEPMRKDG